MLIAVMDSLLELLSPEEHRLFYIIIRLGPNLSNLDNSCNTKVNSAQNILSEAHFRK